MLQEATGGAAIELLVKYIVDRGYQVDILHKTDSMPGVLNIYKVFAAQMINVSWAIFSVDLKSGSLEYLLAEADGYCTMIDDAIAAKRAEQQSISSFQSCTTDQQFLEGQEHVRKELARVFGIPLQLVGNVENR